MNSDGRVPSSSDSSDVSVEVSLESCKVCGKPSAGQHYGVQSCHGCKSFFRRATLKNFRYPECSRGRTCYSDIGPEAAPKKCHKCRIRKCFNVGMVLQVLPSRKNANPLTIPPPDESSVIIQKIVTKEEAICNLIDQLSHLDLQVDIFRKSAYNPVFPPSLEKLIQSPPQLNTFQKYGPMEGWPFTLDQYLEQQMAFKKSFDCKNFGIIKTKMINETLNFDSNLKLWLPIDIIAAIEYAKTFNFFHQLSYKDKLVLIQATTVMNFFLTSTYQSYTKKLDEVHMPDGVSAALVLFTTTNSELASREIEMETRAMGPMIRENLEKPEYLLLKAVILCNSAVPDLSPRGQKIVDRERHKYCSALFSCCKIRHGVKNGPARFYSILSMIGVMESVRRDFRETYALIEKFYMEKMFHNTCDMPKMPKMLPNELLNL